MFSKDMKMFAALAAMVVVVALLVASCGPAAAPEPTAKPAATAKPTEEPVAGPVQGGHLTIAWHTTFEDTMDLHRATATASIALGGNVLDTIIRKHPVDSTYHPGLA
ncbi:MAG: hypothetical protein V3V80_00640, partial [Dehalococcoidia bacterium]